MRNLIIIFILNMIMSCGNNTNYTHNDRLNADSLVETKEYYNQKGEFEYEIKTWSGHEYVRFAENKSCTHSGSCPNPIHTLTIRDTVYLDAMEGHSEIK